MDLIRKEYAEYVKKASPNSPLVRDLLGAFLIGGTICTIGQGIMWLLERWGVPEEQVGTATSILLVFLGALLTALSIYDDIAQVGGAGTLVPITGFSNAVVSPAMEFRSEGFITGTTVKIFAIAGPVLVFGIGAGVIYGLVLWISSLF